MAKDRRSGGSRRRPFPRSPLGRSLATAAAAAALVLAAGLAYAQQREREHESSMALVLVPAEERADDAAALLESIERTGTIETYVRYLEASDEVRRATPAGTDLSVRRVPGTRVIEVSATGDPDDVQEATRAIAGLRGEVDDELGGLWSLRVLQAAQPPQRTGMPYRTLLWATLALALVATLAVVLAASLLRRRARSPVRVGSDEAVGEPPAATPARILR